MAGLLNHGVILELESENHPVHFILLSIVPHNHLDQLNENLWG